LTIGRSALKGAFQGERAIKTSEQAESERSDEQEPPSWTTKAYKLV